MSDTLRAAATMALDALEYHVEQTRPIHKTSEAITALRAALAEPDVPETDFGNMAAAVAEERERCALLCEDWASVRTPDHGGMALLNVAAAMRRGQSAHAAPAAPPQREPYDQTALGLCNACGWKAVGPDGCLNCAPQREPLTDEQARTHCTLWPGSTDAARKAWLIGFRAAERAHGISAPASAPKEQA